MQWQCPRCGKICTEYKMEVDITSHELEVLCTHCGLRWYPENLSENRSSNMIQKHTECPNCHGYRTQKSRKTVSGYRESECLCVICGFRWNPEEFASTEESMTGEEYERVVADKLRLEGYTGIRLTRASSDRGADILAVTPAGAEAVIQCKYYRDKVGQHAVQEAVAAREYYRQDVAIVVTNSSFTPAAREYARMTDTRLIERYL